jgi:hypothetical protein
VETLEGLVVVVLISFGLVAGAAIWVWLGQAMPPPRTGGEEVTKPGWPWEDWPPTATPQSLYELRALP